MLFAGASWLGALVLERAAVVFRFPGFFEGVVGASAGDAEALGVGFLVMGAIEPGPERQGDGLQLAAGWISLRPMRQLCRIGRIG